MSRLIDADVLLKNPYLQQDDICLILNGNVRKIIEQAPTIEDYKEKYLRLKKELEDSTNDSIVEVLEGYWEETQRLQERISYLENEIKKMITREM